MPHRCGRFVALEAVLLGIWTALLDASDECHGFDEMWGLCPDLPKCEECTPIDCQFGDWGEWYGSTDCTGLRFHERTVAVSHNECGKPCSGAKIESEKQHTPQKCMLESHSCLLSDWSSWTECTAGDEASMGQSRRSRQIVKEAVGGGEACAGSTSEIRPCGKGPEPAPCEFTEWQEWTACSSTCGSGRHTRMRSVHRPADRQGEACQGATLETRTCQVAPCGSRDCVLGEWSEWSMCDLETHPQRFRRRHVLLSAQGSGRPCSHSLQETQGCPALERRPCHLSEWSEWQAVGWNRPEPPACSKECGGGQAFRTRSMLEPPSQGGACPSAALKEVKACNLNPCDGSCQLTAWTPWTPCSADCGRGTKTRARSLMSPEEHFAEGCLGALEEAVPCMGPQGECPHTDCEWSNWYDWTECSATCGGGTKQRNRLITSLPSPGGVACTAHSKSEAVACGTQSCNVCVDGLWGAWQDWEPCSSTCRSSFALRRRNIVQEPNSCGKPVSGVGHEYKVCDHLPPCNEDRDCQVSDWADWGHCSATCHGAHERHRYIKVFPAGRGRRCDEVGLTEGAPCNPAPGMEAAIGCQPDLPTDCILGFWSDWMACSKSCGGGQTERKRQVIVPAAHGGRPCTGELNVIAPCNHQSCELEACSDCLWGMWSDWGACSGCRGERYRHRSIEQMPNYCGKMCDPKSAKEVSDCMGRCEEESMLCSWSDWSGYGGCVGSCGSKTISRSRALHKKWFDTNYDYLIVAAPGTHCQGAQINVTRCPETSPCTPPCIAMDCVFGPWGEWDRPSASGLCERRRSMAARNNECGRPCAGPLVETKHCLQLSPGHQNCLLSSWAAWSSCTVRNHVGQRHRERSVVDYPSFDGIPCGASLHETEQCNAPEPVHCRLSEWGLWDVCARSCGGGWQSRARVFLQRSAHGGQPCEGPLAEMRECNTVACEVMALDCLYTDWQEWSTCGAHRQSYRQRKIFRTASGSGLPCVGDLEETMACRTDDQVDCAVSSWTVWGPCDKTCGGGQTQRQRQIVTLARGGGAECPHELMQTTGCNWEPCSAQDCLVSDWQAWSSCSATCGQGQRLRQRQVLHPRSTNGQGCRLDLSQLDSCTVASCPVRDCTWGDWSAWAGCTATCGGGHQSRERTIAVSAGPGGAPCEAEEKLQVRPCSTQSCQLAAVCQDGEWDEWNEWSRCSTTCGAGTRYRFRQVKLMADPCGQPATGEGRETEICNLASCEPSLDCLFSDWEGWSSCSATCNGIQQRSRRVAQYGSGSGTFCVGALKETWPCNPTVGEATPPACSTLPPADCLLTLWTDWSACSASCGGGEHKRSRSVLQAPANGGRQCEGALTLVRQCASTPCSGPEPQDCQYGEWQDWGSCSKCGGERTRHRHVVQYSRHGGRDCEPLAAQEVAACPRQCNERLYCAWGEWADWGGCSARCGEGRRMRRRYLGVTPEPAAPPAPLAALVEEYAELRRKAADLEASGGQELLVAFTAGLVTFVVGLLGGRLFYRARTRFGFGRVSCLDEAREGSFQVVSGHLEQIPLVRDDA